MGRDICMFYAMLDTYKEILSIVLDHGSGGYNLWQIQWKIPFFHMTVWEKFRNYGPHSCVFVIGGGGLLVSFIFPIFSNLTLLTESGTWVMSAGESLWCHGNIDTETDVTTLNNIQRSCIMTVCPLLTVYIFMCYRIFCSVTTFSGLKLTHNGMSMLLYLCTKIMFLVYLMNGWVFCFCMAWSETVLPLFVCVH